MNGRNWGDHKKLDLLVRPDDFLVWRDRALGHLTKDHSYI